MGAVISADALAGIANNRDYAPKLVWSNRFDGSINYPVPYVKGSSRFYVTNQAGIDSLGFGSSSLMSAFNGGASTFVRREVILVKNDPAFPSYGDVVADDETDIPAVFSYSIAPNTLKGGTGNKLTLTQHKRSQPNWSAYDSAPQIWNDIIYRSSWLALPMPALLYKFKMKLPSNMQEVLSGTSNQAWSEQFGIKFDDINVFTEARLALKTMIRGGETGIRFAVAFDLFGKSLAGATLPAGPQELWSMQSAEGSVIQGHTFDVAIYYRPPLSNADLVTGLTQVLITDVDTNTVILSGSKSGVPMMGYSNSNPHRIIFNGIYTGGFPAAGIEMEYSDNEVWLNRQLFPV